MRQTLFTAALLLAAFAGSASADQNDPRLDALFVELKSAGNVSDVTALEAQIWSIWHETDDDDVRDLMNEGLVAMNLGRREAALEAFDRVVELAPDFAEGWNKRATVHYMLDNLEESLADIEVTVSLEPRHFGALSGRGLVYLKLRDLDAALTAFEAARDVNPNTFGLANNIEALRKALGMRDI